MIAQVYVGYEQQRTIVVTGQNIRKLLQNISQKIDNLPSEYQLLYKKIRGHPQQISCKPTFNQFLQNYWISIKNGLEIPTLYIVQHHGREYWNDAQESSNEIFKCQLCFLQVRQHFRCFKKCMDYLLCDICIQIQIQHDKGHQFIFNQRPENWNKLKLIAEVKLRNLQSQDNNSFYCSSCIEMQIKYSLKQITLKQDQVRYSCLECNYDQCQDCYLEGMHQLHHKIRTDYSK